mgnify:CR=1 FL=1
MSNRHRSSKQAVASAAHPAPSKQERQAEHRKTRHRAHELLAHADMESAMDVVPPRPHHTRVDVDPREVPEGKPKPTGREYRHWKQKFWKRRSNVRAEKAALASQELPLPEVG